MGLGQYVTILSASDCLKFYLLCVQALINLFVYTIPSSASITINVKNIPVLHF
jgi:hypothetical protein